MNKGFFDKTASIDKKSSVGKRNNFYMFSNVYNSKFGDDVSIGDESRIRDSVLNDCVEIGRRNVLDHVSIGKGTYSGDFCIMKYCEIGKYSSISWNVSIGAANHDLNKLSISPIHRIIKDKDPEVYDSFEKEHVIIGNDVWIAAGVHILRGVIVGDGAVIAANAVVTKNVPPYAIVAGVPAKIINYRFSKDIIEELLDIKWWNFSFEGIKDCESLFRIPVNKDTISILKVIKKQYE